jgi:isoamylase
LEEDKTRYANYSGTGNTLKANHSVVRRMILDSLHYWVSVMHVDGFRFDLASILSRDVYGQPLKNPPVLWDIESDPVLVGTKLIAEAWDAGGLYQVGSFIGERWKEWNGKFRDDVRTFLRGDSNTVMKVAQRFQASPDLYGHETREPEQSINFVTSHDGFTLNDLVSYNQKHNQANREGNRDGMDYNLSWNCGVEGPTDDPQVEELRVRQIKNFLTINLLALGAPMLLMGDEVRRTQAGNNNAYCQNNEISWFNWTLLEKNRDIHRFVKHLVSFRLNLDVFKEDHGMSLAELLDLAQFQWHGVKLNQPDWGKNSHSLALTVRGIGERFHFLLNAYREMLEFELPTAPRGSTGWLRIVDTSLASPQDFCVRAEATVIDASSYLVQPHSVVVLVAEIRKKTNAVG